MRSQKQLKVKRQIQKVLLQSQGNLRSPLLPYNYRPILHISFYIHTMNTSSRRTVRPFSLLTQKNRKRKEEPTEQAGSTPSSPNHRHSFRPPAKPLPVPPTSLDGSGSEPPSAETTPVSPRRKRPETPEV